MWNRLRYTVWAPAYDAIARAARFDTARRLSIERLRLASGDRVLIVGAGTGLDLAFLPSSVHVTAIDVTPAMLKQLERRAAGSGRSVTARIMDARELAFPDSSFDAIVMHLILAVMPQPDRGVREAVRVLRPGGLIAVFDKFLRDEERPSLKRRWLNAIAKPLFSDLNRRLGPLTAGAGLLVEHDSPVAFGGTYRVVTFHETDGYGRCRRPHVRQRLVTAALLTAVATLIGAERPVLISAAHNESSGPPRCGLFSSLLRLQNREGRTRMGGIDSPGPAASSRCHSAAIASHQHDFPNQPRHTGKMLVDDFLPTYDVSDAVATVVHADLPTTWDALTDVDLIEVGRKRPLVGVLGAIRVLPDIVSQMLHGELPQRPPQHLRLRDTTSISLDKGGWVLLGERPRDEIALGLVGKFWRPVIEFASVSAERFRDFAEPGFAKTIYSLSVRPVDEQRTLLSGVMRTATTDEHARRWFRRYWTFGVGSGAHILVNGLIDVAREMAEARSDRPDA